MNRSPAPHPVFRYVLAIIAAYAIVLVILTVVDPLSRSHLP